MVIKKIIILNPGLFDIMPYKITKSCTPTTAIINVHIVIGLNLLNVIKVYNIKNDI